MLGKVKGTHKGLHMGFQAFQVGIVKGLDRGFFDGAVHALGLPICPRVIRFGQLVSNAVFTANAAKDVHSQKSANGLVTILGQVCKGHAVVGENGVNSVGEGLDDATLSKSAPFIFPIIVAELYIGENLDARSMAKNMLSLPLARRSSAMSMCT